MNVVEPGVFPSGVGGEQNRENNGLKFNRWIETGFHIGANVAPYLPDLKICNSFPIFPLSGQIKTNKKKNKQKKSITRGLNMDKNPQYYALAFEKVVIN